MLAALTRINGHDRFFAASKEALPKWIVLGLPDQTAAVTLA
jgi:hypothetical protein